MVVGINSTNKKYIWKHLFSTLKYPLHSVNIRKVTAHNCKKNVPTWQHKPWGFLAGASLAAIHLQMHKVSN